MRAQTFFKVKKTTRMEKVFNTYAQRKGVNQNSLRFLLDGERINADSTPKSLDLEDQDQIDCMLEQVRESRSQNAPSKIAHKSGAASLSCFLCPQQGGDAELRFA